ncbi:MAG TPA: bifunctional 3'-5' exonuclease/DNA polymerase [Pseudonocardiaceae bacterium]
MLVAVMPESDGGGRVRPLADDGIPNGPEERVADLAGRIGELERTLRPRWLWPATADCYPALLAAGTRVDRCHDLLLVEGLLLNHAGLHAEPRGLAAAVARAKDLPVPDDPPAARQDQQPALFEPTPEALPGGTDPLDALAIVYRTQRDRLAEVEHPDRMRLLTAAESASALTAAEMSHHGLPWRADIHAALLVEMLGPRPMTGVRPKKLAELADQITAAFGMEVNPDHPPGMVRAFAKVGIDVPSTRRWVLRQVDHPAIAPLLEYKELARLYVAHGWTWLDSWVHNGRFRPEYVVGGVVSGRWATNGGAALQLPKVLRTAVRAEPGWTFVAADAAQLEPRVLAALSQDSRLAEVAGDSDLYASLARDAFEHDRGRAKIAMLSAMYGGTSGEAGPLLAVLRRRFPSAVGYVEDAARAGEAGHLVRSRLGRTSPAPSAARQALLAGGGGDERRSRQASREWGRFTRNFVVQASAADWTAALLATLRTRLAASAPTAELVFFQHDEVLVHCRQADADAVVAEIGTAAATATTLVFGATAVRFPLDANVVDCYADAK